MAGHDQTPFRNLAKPNPGIIGLVADQDDQPLAAGPGECQRVLHQGAADPLTLEIGMHRQRPEEQRRHGPLADEHPPIADDAGKRDLVGAGEEGQARHGLFAFAQTVGCPGPTPKAEADIEQTLGAVMVARRAGHKGEGDRCHRRSLRRDGTGAPTRRGTGDEQGAQALRRRASFLVTSWLTFGP